MHCTGKAAQKVGKYAYVHAHFGVSDLLRLLGLRLDVISVLIMKLLFYCVILSGGVLKLYQGASVSTLQEMGKYRKRVNKGLHVCVMESYAAIKTDLVGEDIGQWDLSHCRAECTLVWPFWILCSLYLCRTDAYPMT